MNTCIYLNLPAATQRRAAVEASFAAAAHDGWSLARLEALGPDAVAGIPGGLTGAEKGCFASHRAAIGGRVGEAGHLLVAEDDVAFSSGTFAVLDSLLANLPDWDVIFTDVALCDLSLMVHLARRRDEMAARSAFELIDLRRRSWAGSAAYCIRDTAKGRVFDALQSAELDQPYDLFLRDLADRGVLRMAVCFPFLSTLSAQAGDSQIQADQHAGFDQALAAYRRLMCLERDLDQCRRDAAGLRAAYGDEVSAMVGTVFAAFVSPDFPLDR